MKGDFSLWRHDPRTNDQGVLHQQGRVTLDADLTAGELIDLSWRTRAAQDVIGAAIAAVPASDAAGFAVEAAAVVDGQVRLGIHPGRIWADGVHLWLPAGPAGPDAPVARRATYLAGEAGGGGDVSSIGDGARDVVVLEVALEELSAFQEPDRLLEPALGGPDTTERVTARYGFRLARLGPDESCASIRSELEDGPEGKGRLTVSLDPPETVDGDCPTVEGGGYTGFEHHLYRVEIAATNDNSARFKWSRFNGGLVGRGRFQAGSPNRVVITANRSAILNSGLDAFYLEALVRDEELGHWRVAYGTPATLNSDRELELADPPVWGTFSFGGDSVFFRLWDGIEAIADFAGGSAPSPLRDGINLAFDVPAASASYRPGDYWTFSVRAGEIPNPETLVDDAPPEGLRLRRVPLAEIRWTADADTDVSGEIRDCRRRFRPLTNQTACCTLLVGDGIRTFGDFNSLEEAARHLPPGGGDLCLLPGVHQANLVLTDRVNVRIRGCARRTMVLPRADAADQPVISLRDCVGVEVSELDLVSFFGPVLDIASTRTRGCREVRVRDCRMLARSWVLRADGVEDLVISRNRSWLLDMAGGLASYRVRATDALIERNRVGVWPVTTPTDQPDDPDRPDRPADPCAEPDDVYGPAYQAHIAWAVAVLVARIARPPEQPFRAWSGIHLRGGCEAVRVLENHVVGGAGHALTLGGVLPGEAATADPSGPGPDAPRLSADEDRIFGYVYNEDGTPSPGRLLAFHDDGGLVATATSLDPSAAFRVSVPAGSYAVTAEPGWEVVRVQALEFEGGRYYAVTLREAEVELSPDQAFLYRIDVEGNELEGMALSGIGFRPFTDDRAAPAAPDADDPAEAAAWLATTFAPREILGVANVVRDLVIRNNRIHGNLRAVFDAALRDRARSVGQGGISLGLVETGIIEGNQIHDNGTTAINPACGVFVGYAEDLEIRGNRITGNGPIPAEGFEANKIEGLRSGIFVRFASAFLVGGEADAQQKPAVRVIGNRIDQPAGRALTILAFGPVACLGNHLNSERAGRWNLLDTLAGGALILNLGGIHRHRRPPVDPGADQVFTHLADPARSELLLPGGEVLFNDNQLRLGTDHRSATTTVVLTLDDLGFDGNQSSVFRRDVLLTNALLMAFSVRATDNRFREHTRRCYLSLISWAYGMNPAARLLAMNTTAHNQADHCILALSNAPRPPDPAPHGPPVIDQGNLEANGAFCRQVLEGDDAREEYIRAAAAATILGQQAPVVDTPAYTERARVAAQDATASVQLAYTRQRQAYMAENARLVQTYGDAHPRVVTNRQTLARNEAALQQLQVEGELALLREERVPEAGTVVDGRVTDDALHGRQGLTVELVRADDSVIDVQARTDRSGYYAIPLDAERTTQLQEEQAVFVRVRDRQGQVVHRAEQPLEIQADARTRATITLARADVPAERMASAEVIYQKPAATRPGRSTPLEDVKGIGPVTAQKLRDAGIPDLETYMRTPGARLVEIHGFDARVLRERAQERLEEVEREEDPR